MFSSLVLICIICLLEKEAVVTRTMDNGHIYQAAPAPARQGEPRCGARWVQRDLEPGRQSLTPGFLRRLHNGCSWGQTATCHMLCSCRGLGNENEMLAVSQKPPPNSQGQGWGQATRPGGGGRLFYPSLPAKPKQVPGSMFWGPHGSPLGEGEAPRIRSFLSPVPSPPQRDSPLLSSSTGLRESLPTPV